MTDAVIPSGYIRSVLGPRDDVLDAILRNSLLQERMPPIQVDDNSGRVLQLLTMIHAPERVLEIGALFGYSTIYIARGLPPGGRLTSIEIDADAAALAQRNLDTAGMSDRTDVEVGCAVEYLSALPPESVDMVFIDGSKRDYPEYLKWAFRALRPGALLIADDAFAHADYAEGGDSSQNEAELKGIRTYNHVVGRSTKMYSAFIGTAHGLLVSRKSETGQ